MRAVFNHVVHTVQQVALLIALASLVGSARADAGDYLNFETIPQRALALSPSGRLLFATNTPAGRLEIFEVTAQGLALRGAVSVGLDPVAVAARSEREVWVVNRLSDSVSIVDLSEAAPRVVNTLLVGDEPRDVVFAGPDRDRAFITAARRGQNHPADIGAELLKPGRPGADVWVFDAESPGVRLGGEPLAILPLPADEPGALAVRPDGSTVWAAIQSSGNRTTVISRESVCGPLEGAGPCEREGGPMPGGVPAPNANFADGAFNPTTGIIVRFEPETGAWRDALGRDWRAAVRFELPDRDVFEIDAGVTPPRISRAYGGVGTLNAGMAVHPTRGDVFVANTEAINLNRFLSLPAAGLFPNPEGPVRTADPATGRTLNGHLYESRITLLRTDGSALPRHLNPHIDYEVVPSPAGVRERSVSQPHSLALSPDGETLYVAALGSGAIVPFSVADLSAGTFTPGAEARIELSGGGPSGLAIHPDGRRGFVYTRFDNAVAVVDLEARRELSSIALANPEPESVRAGRPLFYDARATSSNGEAACAVCHPEADKDDLAWDLGSPGEGVRPDPNPLRMVRDPGFAFPPLIEPEFNPLKGPMTALTLRGIADSGPLLWRGDATDPADFRNTRGGFAHLALLFPALLGREGVLPDAKFEALADWALAIAPPPNPVRGLDGSLSSSQTHGRELFFGRSGRQSTPCIECHSIDPARGFFGTPGETADVTQGQNFKIPHLRNQYDKVGMFGRTDEVAGLGLLGEQVRGVGTRHDGSNGSVAEFLAADDFELRAEERRAVADFLNAFPTNLAPAVGQQVTLRADSGADVRARVELLMARSRAPFWAPQPGAARDRARAPVRECELVAKGVVDGEPRGFWMRPDGGFLDDAGGERSAETLMALARREGQELTFTCVYPGGGRRIGIDADADGVPDRLDGAAESPTR